MFLAAPVVAAILLSTSPAWDRYTPVIQAHRRPRPRRHSSLLRPKNSSRSVLTVRHRIARLSSLARLEQRERQLRDFIIAARTETPSFADDEAHALAIGLSIGPTIVTRDFLGSPVIRARVRNTRPNAIFAVLEANITSVDGRSVRAASAVSLQPHESRTVELLCPAALVPATLVWSATAL